MISQTITETPGGDKIFECSYESPFYYPPAFDLKREYMDQTSTM